MKLNLFKKQQRRKTAKEFLPFKKNIIIIDIFLSCLMRDQRFHNKLNGVKSLGPPILNANSYFFWREEGNRFTAFTKLTKIVCESWKEKIKKQTTEYHYSCRINQMHVLPFFHSLLWFTSSCKIKSCHFVWHGVKA